MGTVEISAVAGRVSNLSFLSIYSTYEQMFFVKLSSNMTAIEWSISRLKGRNTLVQKVMIIIFYFLRIDYSLIKRLHTKLKPRVHKISMMSRISDKFFFLFREKYIGPLVKKGLFLVLSLISSRIYRISF